MAWRLMISADGRYMNERLNIILGGKRADARWQFRLQFVKTLPATFGKDTNKIDHRIGRPNDRSQNCIIKRIASHKRDLPNITHRF